MIKKEKCMVVEIERRRSIYFSEPACAEWGKGKETILMSLADVIAKWERVMLAGDFNSFY